MRVFLLLGIKPLIGGGDCNGAKRGILFVLNFINTFSCKSHVNYGRIQTKNNHEMCIRDRISVI